MLDKYEFYKIAIKILWNCIVQLYMRIFSVWWHAKFINEKLTINIHFYTES